MSDIEILESVITDLNGISVPVNLTEQIGIPLYNANNKLKALYNAVIRQAREDAAEKAKETEETEDKPDETVEQSV